MSGIVAELLAKRNRVPRARVKQWRCTWDELIAELREKCPEMFRDPWGWTRRLATRAGTPAPLRED